MCGKVFASIGCVFVGSHLSSRAGLEVKTTEFWATSQFPRATEDELWVVGSIDCLIDHDMSVRNVEVFMDKMDRKMLREAVRENQPKKNGMAFAAAASFIVSM
jgi:hypothetical protein